MPGPRAVNGDASADELQRQEGRLPAEPTSPYLRPPSPDDANVGRSDAVYLAAVFRKLGMRLLPVFFLLNILNYLDRANLAFASINMSQDLDLTSEEYGIGSGLFFIGYTTFQIPSQLIVHSVGAPIWLAVIVTVWGVTAASMAAVTNARSFYIVRMLLGFAEAGSFPGYWYYLTQFYPDSRITLPFAVTDSAIMVAQVVGAPLAAGLLRLDGTAALRGWQWLFLLEGLPTIALGAAMPCLLPRRPISARFLDTDEAHAVQHEVDACRAQHAQHDPPTSRLLLDAVTNAQIYVIGTVKFAKDVVAYGCMFWAPMLIKHMLHRHSEAGGGATCAAFEGPEEGAPETGHLEVLLTGIPYTLAAAASIAVSWHSQRTRDRKAYIGAGYVAGGAVTLLLPAASAHSVVAGFAALCAVIVLALCPNGPLLALASAKAAGPALPLSLALFNSIGNIAGLFAPWLVGAVVQATCSFDWAFYIMGGVLIAGGVLAFCMSDDAGGRPFPGSSAAVPTYSKRASYVELSSTFGSHSQLNHHEGGAVDEA